MYDKKTLRELILSEYNTELGLILNEQFKLFPQTARFYKKYKRYKFWHLSKAKSVLVSEIRYWGLSAVLNAELQTFHCSYWLDYSSLFRLTHWQHWQNRITNKFPFNKEWALQRKYYGHPYTGIFR